MLLWMKCTMRIVFPRPMEGGDPPLPRVTIYHRSTWTPQRLWWWRAVLCTCDREKYEKKKCDTYRDVWRVVIERENENNICVQWSFFYRTAEKNALFLLSQTCKHVMFPVHLHWLSPMEYTDCPSLYVKALFFWSRTISHMTPQPLIVLSWLTQPLGRPQGSQDRIVCCYSKDSTKAMPSQTLVLTGLVDMR